MLVKNIDIPETVGVAGIDEWIVANNIRVDMQYQRPINIAHVRKIVKDFDGRALGVILVSERADGSVYVIDGQHRLAAVKAMDRGNLAIPCHVYRGLSVGDEALIFHMQTQRRAITPIDRFRARIFAGDEQAQAVNQILYKYGLQVTASHKGNGGNLQAIAKVEQIFVSGGSHRLELVLDLVMAANASEGHAPTAGLLEGVNSFLSRYENLYNRARLVQTIRAAGIEKISRNADTVKTMLGGTSGHAWGRVLLALYNKGLHKKLPEWDTVSAHQASVITKKAKAMKKIDQVTA